MSEAGKRLIAAATEARDDLRRADIEGLMHSVYAGVRIMPSDMVDQTTILVTPPTWAALQEKIARDTATAKGTA